MLDRLGMSVEQFASACGLTRTSVYFYLSGKCLPNSQTIHRMAAVLGMASEELFAIVPTREPGKPSEKGEFPSGVKPRIKDNESQIKGAVLKYTKRETEDSDSLVAIEIRNLLARQNPPIGNAAVATSMGVSAETINAIVYRKRIPGVGIINGLARVLRLDEDYVKELLDLRERDLLQRKIDKTTGGPGSAGLAQLSALLEVLNEEQIESLRKVALELAKANGVESLR